MTPPTSPRRRGNSRVTRVVYGAYVVIVAAFVISNVFQVGRALFGAPEPETSAVARAERYPKLAGAECGKLLEEQIQAIDRARLAVSGEPTAETARARYTSERSASRAHMSALEQACSAEPHATEALAALARLDRAAESQSVREAEELSSVRVAAQSFISGHPR
ncbi:MAG TPA: hypothetical protein VM580_27575 [Labilithrix sp.]|nr:hypothetical protein [Labilithrix sp.]